MNLFQAYATDRAAEQDGRWFGSDLFRAEIEIRLRSINSKAVRAVREKIEARNARYFRNGSVVPQDVQEQNTIDTAVAAVADWKNVTGEDGEPLACTEEGKRQILGDPRLHELVMLVVGAASNAEMFRIRDLPVAEAANQQENQQ